MATTRICIDTDIVVNHLRGHSQVFSTAALHFDPCLSAVTLFELESATFLSERQMSLLQQVYQIVTVISLDEAAARASAQIQRSLQAEGLLIGTKDILIAGTCTAHGMPLLTRNLRHFQRIISLCLITPDTLLANFSD